MRRRAHVEKEVDLAALVDILGNMLFFLLATVSFLQLKTLNASVPALSTGPVSTGRAVDVTVEVKSTGFVLKASGEPADTSKPPVAVQMEIARLSDGKLDIKILTDELWKIKHVAPETKNIMIFPEQTVKFDDVIDTMDAAREMPSLHDPNRKVPLFTRPVLSELVTGDEQARDDVK